MSLALFLAPMLASLFSYFAMKRYVTAQSRRRRDESDADWVGHTADPDVAALFTAVLGLPAAAFVFVMMHGWLRGIATTCVYLTGMTITTGAIAGACMLVGAAVTGGQTLALGY